MLYNWAFRIELIALMDMKLKGDKKQRHRTRSWDAVGALLGRSWALLGRDYVFLGRSLGGSLGLFGLSWVVLGSS